MSTRNVRGQARKAGLPPGSPIYTGDPRSGPVRISIIDYDSERIEERSGLTPDELMPYCSRKSVTWVNVDGVHDPALIQKLCELFHIHALTMEDILTIGTRSKCEEYDQYLFIVVEELNLEHQTDKSAKPAFHVVPEQVSVIIGDGYVLTFQESEGDVWDPVRKRLRTDSGRIRKHGSDYLGYALIDAVVDHYFVTLEYLGDEVEELEERAIDAISPQMLSHIHDLKRELLLIRKSVWPLRDVTSAMLRTQLPFVSELTRPYMRDLQDHVTQVFETAEIHRESSVAMLELYLAGQGNRLNQVMKVLTVLTATFIPVTFISGVYGMNFEYMPELHWRYGYFWALALMVMIAGGMLAYFKQQDWL